MLIDNAICKIDVHYFKTHKKELDFLRSNFSEFLPKILIDVYRNRPTDSVYYIALELMRYKVKNSLMDSQKNNQ